MARESRACPHCGKRTKTVFGVCPNCGRAKPGEAVLSPERRPLGSTFWGELDVLLSWGLVLAPGAILFAALILFVGMEILFAAAIVVAVVGVVGSLVNFVGW